MKPIREPNLPEAPAALCAVSAKADKVRRALEALGVAVIAVTACAALPEPVACHADMLLNHAGGRDIFAACPDAGYCRELEEYGLNVMPAGVELEKSYPGDIALNIAGIGEYALIGKRCPASRVSGFYRHSRRCIEVKQGYAKCSTCIVAADAVITADRQICTAARQNGLDALLISPGGIHIEGYDTGFIGGCCGLLSPSVLAFCGDVSLLRDGERIRAFALEHGVYIEQLTGGEPDDIGGILPLMQEDRPAHT